ncbi:hypothetical protein Tsp_04704 [Trichinella spiralis]|uniref:hypothetical protein n=1 Tax=Trichinella spiralis TaxID=6334 RepID=UPI0001EFD9DD|nr:hypothetical protein Tsp_04704 [Trichinella spiralis]
MGGRKVNADGDVPEEKNKAEAEPPNVTENPLQRNQDHTSSSEILGMHGNEQKMDAEMDSVISNTGVSEGGGGEAGNECREDAHAFYHQLQLNELKRLATDIPEADIGNL